MAIGVTAHHLPVVGTAVRARVRAIRARGGLSVPVAVPVAVALTVGVTWAVVTLASRVVSW